MKNYMLSDNLLAQLFIEFHKDFKTKQQDGQDVQAIAHHIGEKLSWSLQYGHLKDLYPNEKHKAYQVLDTVIQSMPAFQQLPAQQRRIEIPTTLPREIHHHHYRHGSYCNHSDPFLTWMVLSWDTPPWEAART